MKKLSLVIVLLFITVIIYSQNINYQLPKVVPTSPEALNFMRYGEIPVDISTGVPNISVPLYTLKSRKLQFPISASYHASGIKVSDRASVIGLGWVLSIKGVLGITVLSGLSFDTSRLPTYRTAQDFYTARDIGGNNGGIGQQVFNNLIENEKHSKDWQSERFSFQLPTGLSGTFRYDFLTGDLLKLPFGSYKVEKVNGTYPGLTNPTTIGFVIIDDRGDRYTFGYPPGGNYNDNYRAMELLDIISADKTDTIRFVYKTGVGNVYEQAAFSSVLETGDEAYADVNLPGGAPNYDPTAILSKVSSRSTTKERVLDSIISSTTIIQVVSVNDRLDMGLYPSGYRTTGLEVYDRLTRNKVNEINFNQSYFGSQANNNRRLRLDSISMKGTTSAVHDTYRFDYENTIQLPPVPEDDPNANPWYSEDYWGYFNNSGSYSKIPQEFVPTSAWVSPYTGRSVPIPNGSGTNRNPDHSYAKAALIKSVTYPTGGKTVFEFEPNHAVDAYYYPGQLPYSSPVGGFRIYQIKNYKDNLTLVETKTYTYSPGQTRTITSDLFVYNQRVFKVVHVVPTTPGGSGDNPTWVTSVEHTILTSQPFLSLTYDHGPPVFYEKVTEYIGDTVNNIGKTEYTYLPPVTTQHASSDHPRFQNQYEQDRGSYTPLLSQKLEYKRENGQYIPVRKTVHHYSTYKDSYYPTGMHFVHTTSYPNAQMQSDGGHVHYANDTYFSTLGYNHYYKVFDLKATQAVDLLTKTEIFTYGANSAPQLVTTTNYQYDTDTHLQPLEQTLTNSKGESIKTKFTYPIDYAGTAVYDNMVALNIISPVIEQSNYKDESFLQSSKTNYYAWSNTLIAPQTMESKLLSNNPEVRLRFYGYDSRGNVITVSKENDVKKTYLWGYNNTYPVAEITNADFATVSAYINQSILDNPPDDATLRNHLSNLRNIPNILVTTYTYKPLIGMTSSTDVNNRTTYYEYDSFGRLSLIKDKDGNILKKFCYNYAGQPQDCQ